MTTRHLPLAAQPDPVASHAGRGALGAKEDELLQVGDVAKATGKTVRAIHLYEELGLLKAHERSKGRYRLFTPESVTRVRWITKLQSLGLSLSEIQALVREQEGSGSAHFAARKLSGVYLAKLAETKRRIAELLELERELEASLEFLSTCDVACESAAPVHSCPSCARHPEGDVAPELVLGVRVS